jgi:predicted TIM-barrel fold metal-dependent hydrolase
MIVDFAAHFHPESVFPEPMVTSGLADRVGPALRDPDALDAIYERAGYDRAVLSQPFYMGRSDVGRVAEANDALLDVVERYERFLGLAAIPVGAGGAAAAAEFERCLDRGYHGGGLETRTNGIELIDAELEPVFDVAASRDAPVFVHPKLDDSLSPDALDDSYLMNAIFGREAALCESVCKVILAGVLEDHPGLDLVYHHTGGNVASMLGRVDLHLRPDWWPGMDHMPSREAFDRGLKRIYVDTAGFAAYPEPVAAALEQFPSSNVLLGTDCPFEARSGEDVAAFAATVEDVAGPDAVDGVLGGNALDLLLNVE